MIKEAKSICKNIKAKAERWFNDKNGERNDKDSSLLQGSSSRAAGKNTNSGLNPGSFTHQLSVTLDSCLYLPASVPYQ